MAAGIRYEVLVESDKRWAVAALCEEEDAAISQARVLLASGRYGAAKVMRERSGMLGLLSSKEVFHEKAAIRPAGRVEAQPADRMWLNPQRVDELYSPAFRRVVLQIVPGWLDEQGLTPTELLHSSVHMKAFRRNDRLVAAFLNQFVQAQIDVPGKPMDRIMQVDRLLTEAGRKAAAFERDRPIAILKPEDGAAAAAKAAAIADPEARRYALTAAVVAHLAEKR
ncbi:MAG TPA: hypothetical protein VEH84_08675, partial [Alphaproteobacteria bacterium]|nr:hypothetical protein [Alphaproteobacteria bacterium]